MPRKEKKKDVKSIIYAYILRSEKHKKQIKFKANRIKLEKIKTEISEIVNNIESQ